jgi:cytochrome c553
MRRALFCLLILLTAFRGVVGDAMAYSMTAGHVSTQSAPSMPCHETANADETAQAQSTDDAASNACTTCQVCHLTASAPSALSQVAIDSQLGALQSLPCKHWLSADVHRASKPPIL